MFSSLRSRLVLTYILLIGLMLLAAAVMTALVLREIPLRTTNIRLQEVARLIPDAAVAGALTSPRQEELLRSLAAEFGVRLLLVGRAGSVLFDSAEGSEAPFIRVPGAGFQAPEPAPRGALRDEQGRLWQYAVRRIDDRRSLVLAAPRPAFQWLVAFRDGLLPPLLWAAGFATLAALLIAGLTARGIAGPLRRMGAAVARIPGGGYAPIEEDGPEEVRQLARAFNEMIGQVRAGRQSQQDFVANVSHELKTPLTAIQGFAGAIRDGTAGNREEIDRAAGVIEAEAARMHRLVVDLLDLARIESGEFRLDRGPVRLEDLLGRVVQKFTPLAQARGVTIRSRFETSPQVIGDADRLTQVFSNLVDNAIRHSPPGGAVTVLGQGQAGAAVISVRDEGPGIPPEERARVFERFYQVDKSRVRAGDRTGFGLGLSIARELVQAHGGEIRVGDAPGRGAVFVVKMPLA